MLFSKTFTLFPSENLSLNLDLITSLTVLGSSHHPLSLCIPLILFLTILQLMIMWKNLVLRSPSTIHLALDFYLAKTSNWWSTNFNSTINFLLFVLPSSCNTFLSSSKSRLLIKVIRFCFFFSICPKMSLFHAFKSPLSLLNFSLHTQISLSLTLYSSYQDLILSMKPGCVHHTSSVRNGFGPITFYVFQNNSKMVKDHSILNILFTFGPPLYPMLWY